MADKVEKVYNVGYIYKITNPQYTDKAYYGYTSYYYASSRKAVHITTCRKGTSTTKANEIIKYNIDTTQFTILEKLFKITKKELKEIEKRYIQENKDKSINKQHNCK
jgi:hypothetical protein